MHISQSVLNGIYLDVNHRNSIFSDIPSTCIWIAFVFIIEEYHLCFFVTDYTKQKTARQEKISKTKSVLLLKLITCDCPDYMCEKHGDGNVSTARCIAVQNNRMLQTCFHSWVLQTSIIHTAIFSANNFFVVFS